MLQASALFGAPPLALAVPCLHLELLETATQLSDERVTRAKLDWWLQTLAEPAMRSRHPLGAMLVGAGCLDTPAAGPIVQALSAVPDWPTPANVDTLWAQALALATPLAALLGAAPATLAAHGLWWRLRLPPAGPHNPGLCPLDLRARHQLPQALALRDWPVALRRDWLAAVATRLAGSTGSRQPVDRLAVLAALLRREFQRAVARPERWRPEAAGHGFGALWTAWRAARRRSG